MFDLFRGSNAETPLQGHKVSINESGKTPHQRRDRAAARIDNLKGKLRRLERKPRTERIMLVKQQTQFAIDEWEKRLKVAEFELGLK